MIILDLSSDEFPVWSKTNSYYGKPFLWCMVHNYGGVRAIYGNLSTIANDPIEARNTPGNTMVGVGMTPEGIETNPVMYDLMVSLENLVAYLNTNNLFTLVYEPQRLPHPHPPPQIFQGRATLNLNPIIS